MSKLRFPLRQELRQPLTQASLERVGERVALRRARGAFLPKLAFAATTVAVVAIVLVQLREPSAPSSSRAAVERAGEPKPGALVQQDGKPIAPVEIGASAAPSTLALSDGTRVTLYKQTRLVPRASTQERCELALERGSARFEVSPQGKRRFIVHAGALRVEVIGTAFRVDRDGAGDTRVEVEHGRVRVLSPDGERLLGKGERFSFAEPKVQAPESTPPAIEEEPAAEPQPEPEAHSARTARETSAPGLEPPKGASGKPEGTSDLRYREALARGDHAAAFAALGDHRQAVLRARSAAELLELADVARGARKPREASFALQTVLERHGKDPRAGLAALTLGKLELDVLREPKRAAQSFARALEASLPDALYEDALARYVRALELSGEHEAARKAAERYKQRFPNGAHRLQVEGF